MNYFKELKEVEEVTGWGKLYYNFIDLDRYDSILMLNYLIDTEPIIKQNCFDEGYEDYLQYSDSFIQEKIIGVTPHLIRKMMDDLEKHEYISVHHAGNDIRRPRYVKLNYDKLLKALGIKRCIKGCIKGCINAGANEGLNAGANEGLNHPTNNLAQNTLTDYQSTKVPEKHYYGETSSPVVISTTSSANNLTENETISYTEPQAHLNQFDEIKSYVLQLTSIDKETKDYLLGWVEQNISSKSLTVNQLRAILKDLYQQCNNDLDLVSQSIKEAYLKSWKNFYVPKNVPVEKKQYSIEKSEEKQEIAEPVVISDLHSFLNS